MSRDTHVTDSPPIESKAELIEYFRSAEKPPNQYRVGTETEKLGFCLQDLLPIPYTGGIQELLKGLLQFGWNPEPTASTPLALVRDGASITIEPGGQIELSGAPFTTIHETKHELWTHLQELSVVCPGLGFAFSDLGCRPFKGVKEVSWMPRERYKLMKEYLGNCGANGHHMMLLSAAIQANYDYSSEVDMAAKMRCATSLSPVIAAIFANSPYASNQWSGWRSRRYAIWLDVDPDRCGLISEVYESDFGYERYLDWALKAPMVFVKRGHSFISAQGKTFRDFLEFGFDYDGEKHYPTHADFELHLSTLFPEARLKKFIEVRSADGGPPQMALALSALCKGIFYHQESLEAVNSLLDVFSFPQRLAMQRMVAQDGLKAHGRDWDIQELASEVVRLAQCGLEYLGEVDEAGRDESIYLEPLKSILATGVTLADKHLEEFGEGPFSEQLARRILEATLVPEGF